MKSLMTTVLFAISLVATGQTEIEKTFQVQAGQKLKLVFDYPELIKLTTWDKKEVVIKGTVSINKGENDDAFELNSQLTENVLIISSLIKDKDKLPKRIVIKRGETEYVFKAANFKDPEVQKFLDENGRDYSYMSSGVVMEITLEVFVPAGMETKVESKYGLVEVKSFNGSLTVDAKYGGVDATVNTKATGELIARTHYGEILSNLDLHFNSDKRGETGYEKWTEVSARPGTGPKYLLESKYGKVYLRKP